MNAGSPDIVVMSPEGEYLIVVELKVDDRSVKHQHVIRQIKQIMASTGCSTGLLIAGESVILLRDSLEKFNGESIYIAGEAKLPNSLLPPADEQWKGEPAIEFESQVQRWLEKLKLTTRMDNFPSDLCNLLDESIMNLLQIGEVRAAHPRWSKIAK